MNTNPIGVGMAPNTPAPEQHPWYTGHHAEPCPSWCERRHAPGYNHNRMVAGIDTVPGADEGGVSVAVVQQPMQAPAVWTSVSWYPGMEFVTGQMLAMTAWDAALLGRALVAMHGGSELGSALVEAARLIDPDVEQDIDRAAGVA